MTLEGHVGDFIYLLTHGEVTVHKFHEEQNLVIALLSEDSKELIGDELLIIDPDDDCYGIFSYNLYYKYSCKVTSMTAKFLKISPSVLCFRAPVECLDGIKKLYAIKEYSREEYV